jgi:phenylacetic acid degradation operon negative regulatory protein
MSSRFLATWIDEFLVSRPTRSNSLLITIYGDFLAPHGGTVWLGSLIHLVAPMRLNERLVRTSVYRLTQEKWLVSEAIGRKSYYSLTASGQRRFEHAYRRIYHQAKAPWSGEWRILLFPPGLPESKRESLRRELMWEGYGQVAPGMLAHPFTDTDSLLEILQEAGVHDKVVAMRGHSLGNLANRPLQDLARHCWKLDALAARYADFLELFRPVLRALKVARELDPEQCFIVQALLMHEYRRALLHDPQLPDELLPANWAGQHARQLCIDLYRLTWRPAQRHLLATCVAANGPLPPAAEYFYERFGGLE